MKGPELVRCLPKSLKVQLPNYLVGPTFECTNVVKSPWRTPHAEWTMGAIHRVLLDHVIVGGNQYLRRLLHATESRRTFPMFGEGFGSPCNDGGLDARLLSYRTRFS